MYSHPLPCSRYHRSVGISRQILGITFREQETFPSTPVRVMLLAGDMALSAVHVCIRAGEAFPAEGRGGTVGEGFSQLPVCFIIPDVEKSLLSDVSKIEERKATGSDIAVIPNIGEIVDSGAEELFRTAGVL